MSWITAAPRSQEEEADHKRLHACCIVVLMTLPDEHDFGSCTHECISIRMLTGDAQESLIMTTFAEQAVAHAGQADLWTEGLKMESIARADALWTCLAQSLPDSPSL